MNGMEMMMKSFLGVDPSEFKGKLEEGITLLKNTLSHFDNRMSALEKQNAEMMDLLRKQFEKGQNNDADARNADNGNGIDKLSERSLIAANGPECGGTTGNADAGNRGDSAGTVAAS